MAAAHAAAIMALARSARSLAPAAPPPAPPPAAAAPPTFLSDGFDVCGPPVLHGVPFAGRARFSMLSHLRAAHSCGGGIFGFMTMRESNKLRVQCAEVRAEVARFEWMDAAWARPPRAAADDSRVVGSVAAWRAAFPKARAVNVSDREDLRDADFAHIRGAPGVRLHTVRMARCPGVTDAAFAHLRDIEALEMTGCYQRAITDAAFAHLEGIDTLLMAVCQQRTITDAAFAHLKGIKTLVINGCYQFTDAAFAHLGGIHTLEMRDCGQPAITGAAFAHLEGIITLNISGCRQITGAAFAHLRGIRTLNMRGCNQPTISDAALAHIKGVDTLDMSNCDQNTITRASFAVLAGVRALDMSGCREPYVAAPRRAASPLEHTLERSLRLELARARAAAGVAIRPADARR